MTWTHRFDPKSMEYGSECGNWCGKCIDCGLPLIRYTGARASKPIGVGYWGLARMNRKPEGNVLLVDFALFRAGKPNAIVEFGPCGKAPAMEIDTSEFSQDFRDMRLRVLSQRECPVVFKEHGLASWPYGTLFFWLLGGQARAVFGDLSIPVNPQEMFILISIATNPRSRYAGQW